jgi:hypothetical protein
MGAQILSAAAYLHLKKTQVPVYADLSYFETPQRLAVVGQPGDCSHWGWQLDPFGLHPSHFAGAPETGKRSGLRVLHDGPEKLRWGLAGLRDRAIQRAFDCGSSPEDLLPPSAEAGYLCLHIRRGDYVNVASHLLDDSAFVALARKFVGLVSCAVVVSDSAIPQGLRQELQLMYPHTAFLDRVDAFSSHMVMRNARILVCSNSQFSLVAAMLNPDALKLIPRQWFGAEQRHIEAPVHELCEFEFLH